MKLKPWTIALGILIIADSLHTIMIGNEANALILWTMDVFDWTLNMAMGMRLLYVLPLLFILNAQDEKFTIITFFAYIGIYILLVGKQLI